jgi:hypothetical protein
MYRFGNSCFGGISQGRQRHKMEMPGPTMHIDDKLARALPTIVLQMAIFAFLALWFVPVVVSKMTGWAELAGRYSFRGPFHGLTWRFQSARMRNWGNYNNCLTVGANAEGLYIKGPWIMARHSPLFIPWGEISYTQDKVFFRPVIRFQLGREQPVPFAVSEKLAARIEEAAGNHWPVKQIQ